MDPEFFRYFIPGLIFWLPAFLGLVVGFDMPKDEGLTWTTVMFAATPPMGWLLYHQFRSMWLGWPSRGYESAPFVTHVRQRVRFRWDPQLDAVLADFRALDAKKLGVHTLSWRDYQRVFHWRVPREKGDERPASAREMSCQSTLRMEPIADLLLFEDHSFDYARTISTVRYAYMTGLFALVNGCMFVGALGLFVWPMRSNANLVFTKTLHMTLVAASHGTFIGHQKLGLGLLLVWIVIGLGLSLWRFRLATREYHARTMLITLANCGTAVREQSTDSTTLADKLIDRFAAGALESDALALDFSETLSSGDLTEALLTYLTIQGDMNAEALQTYQTLKAIDRPAAYRAATAALADLAPATVQRRTAEMLALSDQSLAIAGLSASLPRPDPVWQDIFRHLWLHGRRCIVITTASKPATEVACWRYFGIPPEDVLDSERAAGLNLR